MLIRSRGIALQDFGHTEHYNGFRGLTWTVNQVEFHCDYLLGTAIEMHSNGLLIETWCPTLVVFHAERYINGSTVYPECPNDRRMFTSGKTLAQNQVAEEGPNVLDFLILGLSGEIEYHYRHPFKLASSTGAERSLFDPDDTPVAVPSMRPEESPLHLFSFGMHMTASRPVTSLLASLAHSGTLQ